MEPAQGLLPWREGKFLRLVEWSALAIPKSRFSAGDFREKQWPFPEKVVGVNWVTKLGARR
jgi:hypothetical protein